MRNKNGFTLVEISVVLIIIALIAGAVLKGADLLHQAKIQKIATDIQKITSAYTDFFQKYGSLPGDMANAYNYFGNTCDTTASECNGDGDLRVFMNSGPENNEGLRAYQHMNLANMYPGNFTGIGNINANQATPNVNVPAGPIKNSGYTIVYGQFIGGGTDLTANYLQFGKEALNSGAPWGEAAWGSALTTSEAWFLDTKLDDGNRITGKLMATTGESPVSDCHSGAAPEYYNFANTGINCRLRIDLPK